MEKTINLLKLFLSTCQEGMDGFILEDRGDMDVSRSVAKKFRLIIFLAEQVTKLC